MPAGLGFCLHSQWSDVFWKIFFLKISVNSNYNGHSKPVFSKQSHATLREMESLWNSLGQLYIQKLASCLSLKGVNRSWLCFGKISVFVGPASARSYKIGVVGNNWLVGWLVGNAVFSETALRIFLIFCMKLGDYKGRKVTELDFWKKILDLEIFVKKSPN